MAKEYIEREAAREVMLPLTNGNPVLWSNIKRAISAIPAADVVAVRHGRWKREPDPYGFFDTIPVCSVCDCTTKLREEYLYCPHCGARMDLKGDADV